MEFHSLAQRRALALELLRIQAEKMTDAELDLAMALVLHLPIRMPDEADGTGPQVLMDGAWRTFKPTTDWLALGQVLGSVGLVTGSHERFDDDEHFERVTGYWYSCHAYFGNTETEGFELPQVIGRTVAKLLDHNVQYSQSWQQAA